MAEKIESTDGMFPQLDEAQMTRLMPLGQERRFSAGEIVFDQGDSEHGVFVVLEGGIELASVVNGQETSLAKHGVGDFHGRSEPALGPPQPGPMQGEPIQQAARNQPRKFAAHHAERQRPG